MPPDNDAARQVSPLLLLVGNRLDWFARETSLPQIAGLVFEDYRALTAERLHRIAPDVVISALVGPGFDALDVALALHLAGYAGCYRAISEQLPRPDVIRREVLAIAPALDFGILTLEMMARPIQPPRL